jgi:hypothetical protein
MPRNSAGDHELPESEIFEIQFIEHPFFDKAGTHVNEVIHPIGLVLLKVVGKHRLGFNLFPVQIKRDAFIEKRHTLLEFPAPAIDGSESDIESGLIPFNGLADWGAEILKRDKEGFHICLKHFDDRGFISRAQAYMYSF